MKSFSLLRTNVGLTTNAKIMVNGKYNLYLDAIISTSDLSSSKYKKLEFNKDTYWDEILPYFFRGTAPEIAYYIKDDEDSDNMSNDFSTQYDDLYEYGARNIVENKDYIEEFEYFAPLYISKNNLPTNFIIFRVDGAGLAKLDKNNFKTELLDKLKVVKNFDLTRKTNLGEWLEKNINRNKSFPVAPFFMDFRNLEFSSWFGIDYQDGGYSEKSFMFESILEFEQPYFEFEKIVFDGWKNNKVIFPNILNFSFLFDDTPATPSSLRKWSINRYLGFYLDDLEHVKSVSPYLLPTLKSDVEIDNNNLLYSLSSETPFAESWKKEEFPYIEIEGKFYKVEQYLEEGEPILTRVKIGDNTFEEKIQAPISSKWKIISDINLAGKQSFINKNLIKIEYANSVNKMTSIDGTAFELDKYDSADVWLIEIDGIFHKLNKLGQDFIIYTDYAFYQTSNKFDYYINDPDPNYRKSIQLIVDSETEPKKFGIYRCKFTDIKDFDYDIVNTEYSKFEYIEKDKLNSTDESKMYSTDYLSVSNPKNFDDYRLNGAVVNIPVSSEYTANSETFRIVDGQLSNLWKKNPQRVKWGYQNSISSSDYPYLLNNCFLSEDYNRTTNPFEGKPSRIERNLDYFLTINADSNKYEHQSLHVVDDEIITYESYLLVSGFVTLNNISNIYAFRRGDKIEISNFPTAYIVSIDYGLKTIKTNLTNVVSGVSSGTIKNLTRTTFSLDRYLNIGYDSDYFSYFFGKKTKFDSGAILKNTTKWSIFNAGEENLPNSTLFRGIKFSISDVSSIKTSDSKINSIITKNNNSYENWKFAILSSTNNFSVDILSVNSTTFSENTNELKWQIIDEWKVQKTYATGSLVKYDEKLWKNSVQSTITDPGQFPYNSSDWTQFNSPGIFYSDLYNGTGLSMSNNMYSIGRTYFNADIPPLVFNNNEYYFSTGQPGNTFWDSSLTYATGSVVLYKGRKWKSNCQTNSQPGSNVFFDNFGTQSNHWSEGSVTDSVIWTPVEVWNNEKTYDSTNSPWSSQFSRGHYVIYDDSVWATVHSPTRGVKPNFEPQWIRMYSLQQDTKFEYGNDFNSLSNPIIEMNNRLYRCLDNNLGQKKSTLENGIVIYVNKKWKNILINIFVNDNSFTVTEEILSEIVFKKDYLSNTNRDLIYNELFQKLTASNFISTINNLTFDNGFSDKIKYVIINEDLSLNIYDFNDLTTVVNLPVVLNCEFPDEFNSLVASNNIQASTLTLSEIKANRTLDDGNITSLAELNYYDGKHLAVEINQRTEEPKKIANFSKLKNNIYNNLYRYSGHYCPIFHEIQLFDRSVFDGEIGNYRFDTSLTYFGEIKERLISKVNKKGNILKLRNKANVNSIYPMLDEFGYHTTSFFIFKSTWDYEYHVECLEIPQVRTNIISNQNLTFNPNVNTQNNQQSDL